jgi:Leucine-rich repeat (LRR) protein/uncharacterized membrane protein
VRLTYLFFDSYFMIRIFDKLSILRKNTMCHLLIMLSVTDWTAFFGRFHPALVHLPIGFLMLIAIIEVFKMIGKLSISPELIRLALLVSALSATFSCIVGYCLSLEGGYNEEILEEHKWQGIWVAVFTWVAWCAKNEWITEKIGLARILYAPALAFATLLMFIAGHHGGYLTHGETYLTDNTPQPFRSWLGMADKVDNEKINDLPKIANVNEALVYQDVIHPIFKQKCEQCHNKSKMKGDLRMDEVSLLQKGGKNGVIFKANNVEESEFIKRILLPESDEHHMPPKGKNQISENELSLMKWWVEQGASFDKKVSQLTVNESIKPVLAALGGGMGVATISKVKQDNFDLEAKILTQNVSEIDSKVADEIKKTGALILPLAQNKNFIEINYINNSKLTDNEAVVISKAPEQTIWLKLSNTQITDKTLNELTKLKNLTRLHLEKTRISDNGLAQLKSLQNLEYLNLLGTQITDAGIQNLASMKSLKKIYLWQTKITLQGAEKLQKALPNLVIDLGISNQQMTEFLKDTTKTKDDIYQKK